MPARARSLRRADRVDSDKAPPAVQQVGRHVAHRHARQRRSGDRERERDGELPQRDPAVEEDGVAVDGGERALLVHRREAHGHATTHEHGRPERDAAARAAGRVVRAVAHTQRREEDDGDAGDDDRRARHLRARVVRAQHKAREQHRDRNRALLQQDEKRAGRDERGREQLHQPGECVERADRGEDELRYLQLALREASRCSHRDDVGEGRRHVREGREGV
mmetsp:Transcript_10366/g.32703  ORF Transcript_10366/g.32703 Transcript_10366/m.32703 type:complete len:221 (+) Transcript_10366:233-895(+)